MMTDIQNALNKLVEGFTEDSFINLISTKTGDFLPDTAVLSLELNENTNFETIKQVGIIQTPIEEKLLVASIEVKSELNEKSGRKAQYDLAKRLLKSVHYDSFEAGVFAFHDSSGSFRLSLVYAESIGQKRLWNNFKRFTFFVTKEEGITNKTFKNQIESGDFSSFEGIKETFSIAAVTDLFYSEFLEIYNALVQDFKVVNKLSDNDKASDFVLLFAIRSIFIGFIQKKRWLGDNKSFMQHFLETYKDHQRLSHIVDEFYLKWLSPLFFESLSKPLGHKPAYQNNDFPEEIEKALQMAPYLNGGLFKEKHGYDDQQWYMRDDAIIKFFDFLFSHSFTIEENSLEDEELQLNPEFLGIIFERLINKADGAVYTPRTEVDLMCRLSLLKWLKKNLEPGFRFANLYELFFIESEDKTEQKEGSFSEKEIKNILEKLESVTICDPAVGSGAFLVGMMQVLDEVEESLRKRIGITANNSYERKKRIIRASLYGVEVKEWAVWICQLRLWLSLFVDAPDEIKYSLEPILPSLDFKVRKGDSLVQYIGNKIFPINKHPDHLGWEIKKKIEELKEAKLKFYDNKEGLTNEWLKSYELKIYKDIIQAEILSKQKEINDYNNTLDVREQGAFFDTGTNCRYRKMTLSQKMEQYKEDVEELQNQLEVLNGDSKPLIWSIEFAEIFAEKNGFDVIIGNPPYVRQEDIADPTSYITDKKVYKNLLLEMVKLDTKELEIPVKEISGKSDLYTYFYVRTLNLLNPKGIHTFICSNSWLDVEYGVWLQKFLLENCSIELIIDNQAKRSFKSADVNTIISVIHPTRIIRGTHLTKFIAFRKPFEEAIYTENMIQIELADHVKSNDVYRIYPISSKELYEYGLEQNDGDINNEFRTKYVGSKWGGKFLRAPDIYFTILKKGKDKLVRLGDIADVRRGVTTGCNEFFYPSKESIDRWKIEEEYLKPVIKSPRESNTILINPDNHKQKIFMCNKTKKELENTNALKYIEWGEEMGFPNGATLRNRNPWWSAPNFSSKMFIQMSFNDVFKVWYSENNIRCDARLYTISLTEKNHALLLNCTLTHLFIELSGRANLGEGALDFKVYEASNMLVVNPNMISSNLEHDIFYRPIYSVFKECGIDPKSDIPIELQDPKPLPDRAELDKIVFDILDLTEKERKDVYRGLCRLVWNRISKAKNA